MLVQMFAVESKCPQTTTCFCSTYWWKMQNMVVEHHRRGSRTFLNVPQHWSSEDFTGWFPKSRVIACWGIQTRRHEEVGEVHGYLIESKNNPDCPFLELLCFLSQSSSESLHPGLKQADCLLWINAIKMSAIRLFDKSLITSQSWPVDRWAQRHKRCCSNAPNLNWVGTEFTWGWKRLT